MYERNVFLRPLKLNWIEGRPTLSGGIKSNRLIAEAMGRRGHDVTISFLPPALPWPKPWRFRRFMHRLKRGIGDEHFPHHLRESTVKLNQMPSRRLDPSRVPDADVTFASWWQVWSQVHAWPEAKGLKVHYVRGLETYHGNEERVLEAYRLRGPCVVISTWLRGIVEDMGHARVAYVPNGVDWDQFDSAPRSKASRPTIGMLMGHGPAKDTPTGFEAIRILQREFPDLRVLGFGSRLIPPHMAPPDCIDFVQNPPQDRIPEMYQQADCWVIPSKSEGFGMPGIEAMACHCPIVSTKCGGPADFVREGENGYLVEISDAEAMADRIARVLRLNNDEWQRMSARSYEIAQEFDWDKSAEKLEAALYEWLGMKEQGSRS